jgi:hypothetical protein
VQYSPYNPWRKYTTPLFEPMSATAAGLALAGGAVSAMGTLAGGSSAAQMGRMRQQAANFTATQDTMNSASEIAAAGRRAAETNLRANLTRSSAVANAAAGGVNAGTGSALTNEAQIAARGHYAASLDLWNGENASTADLNRATAAHYTGLMDEIGGEMEKRASQYSAMATLASSGGTAFRLYGMRNPGAGSPGGNSWG